MLRLIPLVVASLLIAPMTIAEQPEPTRAPSNADPVVMRLGYGSFDGSADSSSVRDRLALLDNILAKAAAASEESPFARPIEFSIVMGNPYQVAEWIRQRHIDAAIVGPLSRALLPAASYETLASVVRHPESQGRGEVWVHTQPISDDPLGRLHETFESVLACARSTTTEPDACTRTSVLHAYSHLTTASFLGVVSSAHDWLSAKAPQPDAETKERFWRTLNGLFDFHFMSGKRATPEGGTAFWFAIDPDPDDRKRMPLAPGFTVSDDSFVVRKAWISDFVEMEGGANATEALQRILTVAAKSVARPENFETRPESGCRGDGPAENAVDPTGAVPHLVCPRKNLDVVRRIEIIRKDAVLGGLFDEWYGAGLYEFSIEDIVEILLQDQRNSDEPSFALVLPGGGVKSAYQARLLDELYGSFLSNSPEGSTRGADSTDLTRRRRLGVQRVIGTSGGAITGVFAALRPPHEDEEAASQQGESDQTIPLANLWKDVEDHHIFSRFEAPRWAGVIVSFAIFASILVFSRRLDQTSLTSRSAPEGRDSDLRMLAVLGLMIVAFPVLAKHVSQADQLDRDLWPDAAFFAWLVIFSYGALSMVRIKEPADPSAQTHWDLPNSLVVAAGIVTILIALISVVANFGSGFGWAIAAEFVFVSAAIGFAVYRSRRPDHWVYEPKRLAVAFLVSGSVVLLTHVGLLVLDAASSDFSLLEITPEYWLGVGTFASLTSLVLVALCRKVPLIKEGIGFLCESQAHRIWQGRRVSALAILGVASFTYWNVLISPGLYQTDEPRNALEENLRQFGNYSGALPDHFSLSVDLILTAATLEPLDGFDPGDLYFCFRGPAGCPMPIETERRSRRWIVKEPSRDNLMNLIVASGAAFPVFSPHEAEVEKTRGFLVDGGYGHNVPIEAAALSDSRQVLIVHSSPRESPLEGTRSSTWYGHLVRYMTMIPAFLFERSQQLDVVARSRMVVASLAPSGESGSFPFLADFRRPTITRILQHAESDIDRRIGRIESWGLPGRIHYVARR